MSTPQYSFNWDSYKNNICKGFAQLQQREEFVDMTLVADGHLVKVHKNLLALASPYIKEIILTATSQYPIVFLNNVSHEILCYILEYVYTGEVKVEVDKLHIFLKAAEDLRLCGISNMSTKNQNQDQYQESDQRVTIQPLIETPKDRSVYDSATDANDNDCDINMISMEDNNKHEEKLSTQANVILDGDNIAINFLPDSNLSDDYNTDNMDNEQPNDDTNYGNGVTINMASESEVRAIEIDSTGLIPHQYTVSIRGSLQLILNRFIYHLHHQSAQGRKRRWRCIDYRLHHCPAYIDTLDEAITTRKNMHTHPYHDDKILKKANAKKIFGTLGVAISAADNFNKKPNDSSDLII